MNGAVPTSADAAPRPAARPSGRAALWFGFLGAPIGWLVHLGAVVALVPVACETGSTLPLHVATVLTGAVALAAVVVARANRATATGQPSYAAFLATTGSWMGVLFLVLIVLEGLPVFALDACG